MAELLKIDHLTKVFRSKSGQEVRAVNDLSMVIEEGKSVAVVGESGCGKSTLAKLITRMETQTSGRIFFEGEDLCALKGKTLQKKRQKMQMVFQQPLSCISPRMHIGTFLSVPLINFNIVERQAVSDEIDRLLELVRLPAEYKNKYPHEVSGGELQRIVIARAMAARPHLIICDEATSALDVSVQKDIITLLKDLNETTGVTYLFITHDLSLVNQISDRIIVMYQGRIMESMSSANLKKQAVHPYSQFLLSSVFTLDEDQKKEIRMLEDFEGPVYSGCPFNPRCPLAGERCRSTLPELEPTGSPDHLAACFSLNR